MAFTMVARALALCVALCAAAEAWISRGPNSCASLALSATTPLARSFCCRGWTSAGESRLCVKPICKSDCGAGTCVSPNRCGCSDGTLQVSCVDGSSGLPDSERAHGHLSGVAHERSDAGEHSDRQVARRDPGAADVVPEGEAAATACSRGAPCDGAQAQQAAPVEVSSDWSPCVGTNCPRMQLDSSEVAEAGDENGHEAADCNSTPCHHRRPASAPQPTPFGVSVASSVGSAGSGDVSKDEEDKQQAKIVNSYSDDDRLAYIADSVGDGSASRAVAERTLHPMWHSSRLALSDDDASNFNSEEEGDVAASAKRRGESSRLDAANVGWSPEAGRRGGVGSSSSGSAIRSYRGDHGYRGSSVAGADSAAASFSTAVEERSDASLQYVEGRANDVYVRARMAASNALDGGRVVQRMSADWATAVEQPPQPPRPPRVATGPLRQQPLVLVDGGGADANENGLPVIVGPVFAAAKPAFPFAAASKPEPAGGRSGSAGGVRTEAAVAAPSRPCSREHSTLAADSHGGPAVPCGGTGYGVPQLARREQPASESPCSARRCSGCTTCDDASAAAAVAVSPAARVRPAYRTPQPSELCSPGFVAVSDGDLIVCERITREQEAPLPCNRGSPCSTAAQASCDSCPPGVELEDTDVEDMASMASVNRHTGVSAEGRRLVNAISDELLPTMPTNGGCGGSFDSGCLSPAAASASEQYVPCGGRVNVGGDCRVANGGVANGGVGSSSSSAARAPGMGGDSRNSCWLTARLGISDRDCRRGAPPVLPTTPNPNCVHGALSRRDGTCECKLGFWGERCDKDFDECDAGLHDCAFGCVNTFGSYKCVCAPGSLPSEGNDCFVRPCPACLHGGQCFDGRCQCPSGFRGAQCEEDIDECRDGRNGCSQLCRNTFGSHVCLCRPGFRMLSDNRTCEEKTCKNPCLNGGECVRSKCICTDGFVGVACQFEEKKMAKKFVHRR